MTYFLVMGTLAVSTCFALGWGLWRSLSWLLACLPGQRGARKPARQAQRRAAKRGGKTPSAAARRKPSAKPAPRKRRDPGRLTCWLAARHAALPLALVASLAYLAVRLAEYGLHFRPPHDAPAGYQSVLVGLGWLAAGLLLMALCQRLATWRCR
ncbi:hypothetical protein [Halomonas sp. NO4]|uniref:hypothetical protein n=1 Tax=Halomonas sp. NO4 TaxID=2484813 RepID=UPI0013CFF30F|nr:hypothetical protein [Halomonas sp. NO4]